MYGTVAKMTVVPDKLSELMGILEEWDRDVRPHVKGAMGSVVYQTDEDANTLILCVVFADKETYEANAESPEQDKWYQQFRECLTADPEWTDGKVLANSL